MKQILQERKDIAFYIKVYALNLKSPAYEKAKAILCEKSLAMLEASYEKAPVPPANCQTTQVDDNIKLAQRLGIHSAPTIILPDGRLLPGAKDAKTLMDLIGPPKP
jgi:thiol:disulfide interchange protein DsbC